MAEVERKLGFSPRRYALIEDGLKPVVRELLEIDMTHLYLGGSFVTVKLSPNDIDGYILAKLGSNALREVAEQQEIWRTRYQVDIYPALTDIEGYGSQAYWEEWFGQTADDPPRPKGIVKLLLGR